MDARAREALSRLLAAGEGVAAGVRQRAAALTLTALADYRAMRSLSHKEAFESAMLDASARGAVKLAWERPATEGGFLNRVTLLDATKLARFLGESTVTEMIGDARSEFEPWLPVLPVLDSVLEQWRRLRKVRGYGPESTGLWIDAARVIEVFGRRDVENWGDEPLREASARLFNDSKRIERLTPVLDVLLSGAVDSEKRDQADVLSELGLFREAQPMLLAGNVTVARTRVTAVLDEPYGGLPAASILKIVGAVNGITTVENKTTFHSEAKRRCNEPWLVIFTGGMPSPAWRAAYCRLLASAPASTPIFHWGDIDEGGFRIASVIAASARTVSRTIEPYLMDPCNVASTKGKKASAATIRRMRYFAETAGWSDLANNLEVAGITVEQERLES